MNNLEVTNNIVARKEACVRKLGRHLSIIHTPGQRKRNRTTWALRSDNRLSVSIDVSVHASSMWRVRFDAAIKISIIWINNSQWWDLCVQVIRRAAVDNFVSRISWASRERWRLSGLKLWCVYYWRANLSTHNIGAKNITIAFIIPLRNKNYHQCKDSFFGPKIQPENFNSLFLKIIFSSTVSKTALTRVLLRLVRTMNVLCH